MNPDEIKEKAAKLAELYAAVADGKTLEVMPYGEWVEWNGTGGPDASSNLSHWRVKPEPRRIWTMENSSGSSVRTDDEDVANTWKSQGHTVTEWQEVLP